jgi:hypothetical protein
MIFISKFMTINDTGLTPLTIYLGSKGIEPFMVKNQFFYREPLLPIRSPARYIKFRFNKKLFY